MWVEPGGFEGVEEDVFEVLAGEVVEGAGSLAPAAGEVGGWFYCGRFGKSISLQAAGYEPVVAAGGGWGGEGRRR